MFKRPFFIFLILLSGCCPQRFVPDCPPHPLPEICLPIKPRVALVLGSGGVRGMAHVGVIEELTRAGIVPDLIVGCSAGSIVGALYAANPDVEALKTSASGIRSQTIVDMDLINCRFGLCQSKPLVRVLRKNIAARTFDDLQIPLVVVASDLHSGELVPMGGGDLIKAVQASCSIPFVFVPCKHYGRVLVDGGVVNPVPVKVARDLGAEIIIAVDLSEVLPQTFPKNLFQVASRSAEIAYLWLSDACVQDADILIQPHMQDIGTFNDKEKWKLYEAGRVAARALIPKIQKLIAKKPSEEERLHTLYLSPYAPKKLVALEE